MCDLNIIILAGGKGKRMQSVLPKVLHTVAGKPMIVWILEKAFAMQPKNIYIVVSPNHKDIKRAIDPIFNVTYVVQPIANGTGGAVKEVLYKLPNDNSNCVILNGDVPLISLETLTLLHNSFSQNYDLQITAINLKNPYGHGRIVVQNDHLKIVEEKDCSDSEKLIKLSNAGIYVTKANILHICIPLIKNNNVQCEYYLTDIVDIANSLKMNVQLYTLPSEKWIEIYNINTKEQLEFIENIN